MKLQFDLNRDEIFEKLLNGELSESEKAQVISAINKDERLKKEFAISKEIHTFYKNERKKQLKDSLIELEKEQSTKPNKKGRIILLKKAITIAACLCGIMFLGKLTFNPDYSHQELYAQHFEAYPNVYNPIVRSNQSNILSIDSQIMNLYEKKEYKKSVELFDQHYNYSEKENELNFYMAISYMKINDIAKAKAILLAIPEESKYYEKSKWYLSLCYLNENDIVEFTKIANTLTYKKETAEEILKALK